MRSKHKILLPIIIDRPESGRIHHKFYSFKSFYGFILIMFAISLFIAFLNDKEVFFFMLTDLIGYSMFIIIPSIFWMGIRLLFGGSVVIENGILTVNNAIMNGKKEKYDLKNIVKILWVVADKKHERSKDSLFLIDQEKNKSPFIKSFYVNESNKIWHNFIDKLAKATGLVVEKEFR